MLFQYPVMLGYEVQGGHEVDRISKHTLTFCVVIIYLTFILHLSVQCTVERRIKQLQQCFSQPMLARSVSNLLDNISSGISMLAQNLRRNLHLRLWHIRVALVLSTSDFWCHFINGQLTIVRKLFLNEHTSNRVYKEGKILHLSMDYILTKKTPHTNFVGKSDYAHLRNVLGKYNAVKQRHDFSGDCTTQLQSNH